MTTWDYLTVEVDWQFDATKLLNDYGKGGWELVAVIPTVAAVGSNWTTRYMMKRPRLKGK